MKKILSGKKILITAGPVWVPLDKVRVITSIFGGALGAIMAENAEKLGADVLLIIGPGRVKIKQSKKLKVKKIKYCNELFGLMEEEISSKKYDVIIHSAAVPDYAPNEIFNGKIKSGKASLTIKLKPTVKIVDYIKKWDPSCFLVKFKLEVGCEEKQLLDIAQKSKASSNADIIVANDLNKMAKDKQEAFIISNSGTEEVFTKKQIAEKLLETVSKNLR